MFTELHPGCRLLDTYICEAPIGRGGMGEVWRGRHQMAGISVAIKLVRCKNGAAIAGLDREAMALQSVRHPNVVTVFDYEQIGPREAVIVMEFVRGDSLAVHLGRAGSIPIVRATDWACDVLAGLSAVHAAGLVHCDIKPSNVILQGDRKVHIIASR